MRPYLDECVKSQLLQSYVCERLDEREQNMVMSFRKEVMLAGGEKDTGLRAKVGLRRSGALII